jgi:uncharacterized UPF0160 family protein
MIKVIVHDGLFHADDVLSVALIHRFLGEVEVERKRTIAPEEMDDPDVWVVDVGRQYAPERSCFDHHQDADLPASCVLILNHLLKMGKVSDEFLKEIREDINTISYIDINGYESPVQTYNGFQVNSLISRYNSIEEGFMKAVEVMVNYVESVLDTANKVSLSKELWEKAEYVMVNNAIVQGIKICTAYPIKWKEYEGAKFLIVPEKGDWKLLSKDSNLYPIVPNGKEKFIHAGKFIAIFPTKEDAIHSALIPFSKL